MPLSALDSFTIGIGPSSSHTVGPLRAAGRTLLCAVLCGLTGCATLPRVIEPSRESPPAPATESFYLLGHGWHTGIVVRAEDLNRRLPELRRRFPTARYYEVGWGDSGFYQSRKVTVGLALRAMFHSPGTVVQVVGFREPPARFFPYSKARVLSVSAGHYQNLLAFIQSSIATGADGRLIPCGQGLYGDGQFYAAVGTYHICNTCNKWTAKALYSAGMALEPALKLTASSVLTALPDDG